MTFSRLLEVRDRCTTLVVLVSKLGTGTDHERWLAHRAGFSPRLLDQRQIVAMAASRNGSGFEECHTDPYCWKQRGSRTLFEAHRWLHDNAEALEKLPDDYVLDVEFVLGERSAPKKSEVEESVQPL